MSTRRKIRESVRKPTEIKQVSSCKKDSKEKLSLGEIMLMLFVVKICWESISRW